MIGQRSASRNWLTRSSRRPRPGPPPAPTPTFLSGLPRHCPRSLCDQACPVVQACRRRVPSTPATAALLCMLAVLQLQCSSPGRTVSFAG